MSLGEVSVFGSKLRVNVTDHTAFETYCQKHKADFTTRPVDPTLDDVFLKAISGAK